RIDFGLAVAAFLGVILIDILVGIVIGIILSLLALIYRASFPEGTELGRIEDEEGNYEFVGLSANPDAETLPEIVFYRQSGSLIFSNAAAFSQQARELLWARTDPPASVLVVDCEQMADMDVTGAEEIVSLHEELRAADVELWLARLHGDALVTAEKAGVIAAIGEDHVVPTIRSAGQTLRNQRSDTDEAFEGSDEDR
ncbi:MAG: sodium-independent anion transporter, partial [Acidobacteria bacterium]|nr:sodium-independent anion transporter [Acidobacteriota bacterium]